MADDNLAGRPELPTGDRWCLVTVDDGVHQHGNGVICEIDAAVVIGHRHVDQINAAIVVAQQQKGEPPSLR